ncbi:exodeoxyribonuclease V subunit alpha [Fulvimonas soli]|jgi:exodeoxyribonuclease V alpha subunit|uniref:RecBCD enzyme subunit RecD n=1 Tax=Fulvimonas soli TaxID=155197 RepID=A0A316HQQ3_9GAMM|nr:exodeoxyribonuclease V subunit alpha [Fulvimonas soli]PWK82732.1 DNA helicase/exodeoxyribonuclease V alpha subunit [Fulvimonas soli]TNY26104.1 exodeoxyribonuclease V subunit alpha [Fulvimonas soli]
MSSFDFTSHVPEPAEPPWRPLDRAVRRWTLAHGGSVALADLAAWASLADGAGDTALPLLGAGAGRHGLPPFEPPQLDALRGEPLVGDGTAPTPFVLDAAGRFYLWRNHADEVAVAALLRARRAAGAAVAVDAADLGALFHGDASAAVRRQREAVRNVAGRRLFVLTGGPGTGKTTTVLRMLLMLQKHLPEPRIAVAAPTGKAAQRLVQSLRAGKQALLGHPAAPLPHAWHALLDRIPDGEALTLHRLLGYDPRRNRYARDRANPLAADVVVVDEASMIDLGLLRALLEAVRPEAALVLVGDADQLTSVGAGSVLLDLVSVLEAQRAPELVRLEHSFRAEQPLAAINRAVREGDAVALREAFRAAGAQAQRHEVESGESFRRALQRWTAALAELPLRPVLPADDEAAAAAQALAALRALSRRQLLCALREGAHGALAANAWIERRLKQLWNVPEEQEWYPGRAVLVVRNDYAARLFNGDVGLCLADAAGRLRVWFEGTDADGRPAARAFGPGTVPSHEGAFAVTIHKSQGSEYDHVAVLLPPDAEHRILSRQLLYTGLSRARRQVELWGSEAATAAALAQPAYRAGGLRERLGGD